MTEEAQTVKYRTIYRQILSQRLSDRINHNPRYSLRAFARDLGLSASRISEILAGKQGLSTKAAAFIADKLGFSGEEKQTFCDLTAACHARSPDTRMQARQRLTNVTQSQLAFQQVTDDTFRFIADWYHMAILQLMRVDTFKFDVDWIAKSLGIKAREAAEALERLQRLELIEVSGKKAKVRIDVPVFGKTTPSESIRRFHQQILDKASSALHLQSLEQREFNAVLVSTNAESIQLVKQMMRDFAKDVVTKLNRLERKTDTVHCLSLQLFQLSEKV